MHIAIVAARITRLRQDSGQPRKIATTGAVPGRTTGQCIRHCEGTISTIATSLRVGGRRGRMDNHTASSPGELDCRTIRVLPLSIVTPVRLLHPIKGDVQGSPRHDDHNTHSIHSSLSLRVRTLARLPELSLDTESLLFQRLEAPPLSRFPVITPVTAEVNNTSYSHWT